MAVARPPAVRRAAGVRHRLAGGAPRAAREHRRGERHRPRCGDHGVDVRWRLRGARRDRKRRGPRGHARGPHGRRPGPVDGRGDRRRRPTRIRVLTYIWPGAGAGIGAPGAEVGWVWIAWPRPTAQNTTATPIRNATVTKV